MTFTAPSVFPRYWRLCKLARATRVGDLDLAEGDWVVGFRDEPPPSADPYQGSNCVEGPKGAVAAVRLYVSESAAREWASCVSPQAPSLSDVLNHEMSGMFYRWERELPHRNIAPKNR